MKKEIVKTFQIGNYRKTSAMLEHFMMKSKQHGAFLVESVDDEGYPKYKQLTFVDLVHSSKPLQDLIILLDKLDKI